ncbi:MAG: apolipoprotein N-acyltransferase [Roseovarius sp.]|nr:apolipoprotein N-acyltransferase [Roseovarius sp.]
MAWAARFARHTDGMRPRNRLMVCAGLGAAAALGQAPVNAWPVTLVALALLYGLFARSAGWRASALQGWAAGTGYFMLALSWIVEPFLVDIARHGWMAPVALLFMAGGLALFWALGWALARLAGGGAMAWIGALVLAEALRGTALTGFPWAQIGHVWIATPILHWAAYGGALALTALTALTAVALWWGLAGRRWMAVPVLVVVAVLFAGGGVVHPSPPVPDGAPTVRLVQPNAPQHQKWDPALMPVFYQRQLAFTRAGQRPDLIVWPETAVPVMLGRAAPVFAEISDAAGAVPVVVGLRRRSRQRLHNSMVALDPAGKVGALYDKHHLVPFGEYVPFGDALSRFGITGLAARQGHGYSPGPGAQVIGLGPVGRALALICYEGVFPRDVAAAPERPDFMLLITNDAWFGQVSGPYQHLAQARLRSAEQGLPMVRVANTGVSAMIDATGRVTARIPLGRADWRDAPLPAALPPTPYAVTGDWPMLVLAAALLAVAGRRRRANSD